MTTPLPLATSPDDAIPPPAPVVRICKRGHEYVQHIRCKACQRLANTKWRNKHRDHRNAYMRAYGKRRRAQP